MAYIFLDESGCLGFDFDKQRTSRNFLVTCLFTSHKGPIEKIAKKIFKSFTDKEIKRHHGVLHCNRENERTRVRVLEMLAEKDCRIMAIILNKAKVHAKLRDQKHILYNFVVNILLDRICSQNLISPDDPIQLIASQRETKRYLNENFLAYVKGQIRKNHDLEVEVLIRNPSQEKCLQIVDFASWALFRKVEFGDWSYFNIFKDRVVEENSLFP